MAIYISLLRGINVSGQKKVNMKALKSLYESLNLEQVTTYIQSGNVVFSCTKRTVEELKTTLEKSIEQHFNFHVPILVLSKQTLATLLAQNPFADKSITEQGSQIIFSFFSAAVTQEKQALLHQYTADSETLFTTPTLAYLHCPNGYGKTKLSNTFLENKLGVTATSRNLKTIVKLCDIATSIQ